jgi:hypothetical protein
LIELAAVMATDKVSRKAAKASKAFSNFIANFIAAPTEANFFGAEYFRSSYALYTQNVEIQNS